MKKPFEDYKNISKKVLHELIKNDCSTLSDIDIIYNILRGFPYCINEEGNYVYGGNFYPSLESLPPEALMQIMNKKFIPAVPNGSLCE